MQYEIKYRPSYAMAVVRLEPGESIAAEAGAMTYMTPSIQVNTRMRQKSLFGSLVTSVLGGESFFVNDFVATGAPGEAGFVAAPVGDIDVLEIAPDHGFILQKSAYVASQQGIDLDVQWQGFTKGLFGQGLFMIKVTGDRARSSSTPSVRSTATSSRPASGWWSTTSTWSRSPTPASTRSGSSVAGSRRSSPASGS